MDAHAWSNLVAYSAQVACIAGLGTAVAALLHIDAATVRYAYWRGLLALCLALPWIQVPRDAVEAVGVGGTALDAGTAAIAGASAAVASRAPFDWLPLVAAVLITGAVARLIWVGASLVSLHRLRSLGASAAPCELHDELQGQFGTRADIRYVPGLKQPVTFGALHPVVLLPDTLREHAETIQRAVLCHELLHVQRRDWLWVLGEEAVRIVLWFHPAAWWLVARVQLAREEVIDELAVLATGRRRTYIEALMAFADETPFAPAAAFARRRHLFRRVVLISKEGMMSSTRIVMSGAVMAVVVLSGSYYAASAFPLTAQGQHVTAAPGPLEQRAVPVTPENPVPKRTNYTAPFYPHEAAAIGAGGTVTLRVTLDELGRVAEVRRSAFSLDTTNPHVRMSFSESREPDVHAHIVTAAGAESAAVIEKAIDALTRAATDSVRQWRYEPPAQGPMTFGVTIAFRPDGEATATVNQGTPARHVGRPTSLGAVRVGGKVKPPTKIRDVRPVYPPEAQAARVSGVIIIEAHMGADGNVEHASVLRSIPLLDQAAVDAVMQWQFTPTLIDGVPTPVIMTVTVNFTLK